MKTISRIGMLSVILGLFFSMSVYANPITWEDAPGHHNESILLNAGVKSATDSIHQYGRGEYLAEGTVEIVNRENGEIYICIDTYAYINVDRIFHSVFLDYWSDEREDWVQAGYWDFETTKEEHDGALNMLCTSLTLTGYETDLYYRVRGLHGVEVYDEVEACATRTNGVLITDN